MNLLRFAWKQYRFELVSIIAGLLALTGALIFATLQLEQVRLSPECVAEWGGSGGDTASDCGGAIATWSERRREWMFWVLRAAPYVAGIVLGSVVVSREIEHRTAQLGWSLRGSRRRWLSERITAVGLLLGVALTALAVAAVVHEAAWLPGVDPRASFNEYGTSGPPLVVRGLAVFAAAVLLGAMIGRQLPALILSAAFALVLATGVSSALPFGAPTVWVPEEEVANVAADVTLESGWRSTDGTILSYDEAAAGAPVPSNAYNWIAERYEAVVRVLAGSQRPEVEIREAVALGALTALLLTGSYLVVDRRRPY